MSSPPPSPGAAPWSEVRALFDALAPLPPAERAVRLAAPALDAAVAAEVRSLLAHHDAETGGALSDGAAAGLDAEVAGPTAGAMDRPDGREGADSRGRRGERLGPWQLVEPLGRGGMGEVWLARRADGAFTGEAAVKLLRAGLDSTSVLARFAQERQALARLAHPHIARLLDAGASADGLPYFVMERVDGQPLHEAALAVPLEQRLGYFLQLTDAVAHAHRNLLVHRDLKPSNVLVDREGRVKLLDFGIAKALDPLDGFGIDGAAAASLTQAGERPFTPHYASPEQVRGEPVSTATDIYSLGVLLYQMLTGARPTGRSATTPIEVARSVLEEEPTRPSRLAAGESADPRWPATRRRLEGDLDNIVLKALEKAPERRYASVDALAADVRAYLAGYPVSARAPSAAYLVGKFVRRNPWGVLAGVLGGLGLASGLAAALLQERVAAALGLAGLAAGLALALALARRAALARDQAAARLAEAKGVLRTLVQQHADAVRYLPGGVPAHEAMLGDAVARLERLARAAPDDGEIAAMLAVSHARLADLQLPGGVLSVDRRHEGLASARRALALFERAGPTPGQDPDALRWQSLATALLGRDAQQRGALDEAKAHLDRSLALLRAGLARWPGDTPMRRMLAGRLGVAAQLHQTVGWPSLNRPEAALAMLDEARELYQALIAAHDDDDDHLHLAMAEGATAVVHQVHDRLDLARAHLDRAVAGTARLVERSQGENTAFLHAHAMHMNNLSYIASRQGDDAAALEASAGAVAACERLLRHDPRNAGWRQRWAIFGQGHAERLVDAGRHAEALALLERIEPAWQDDAAKAAAGAPSFLAARRLAMNRLGQARCRHALGDAARALELARGAERDLAALTAAEPAQRDWHLYRAEVLAALAAWEPAAAWRERALAAYAAADALQPLQHDHLRAWRALQGGA